MRLLPWKESKLSKSAAPVLPSENPDCIDIVSSKDTSYKNKFIIIIKQQQQQQQ